MDSRPGSKGNLWIQPLVGSKLEPYALSEDSGNASVPAFSPDGKWIAYSRNQPPPFSIWIVASTGGQSIPFMRHSNFRSYQPAWSRGGDRIAFISDRSGRLQIWVAEVKDGRPAGEARMLPSECAAYMPTWSPDSSWIAFLGVLNSQNELWIVPSDGSAPARQVTRDAGVRTARWAWKTDELVVSAYWSGSRISLRRVSPETGSSQPFHPVVDFGGPDSAGLFDVSTDGTRLLFLRQTIGGRPGNDGDRPANRSMCGLAKGNRLTVDVDGQVYACAAMAESYQEFASELLESSLVPLRMGDIKDPRFRQRYTAFLETAGKTDMLTHKEKKYSSYGRCRECEFVGECSVCPVSIGYDPGNADPHRVPDFICAFNRTALKYRDRFSQTLDMLVKLEALIEELGIHETGS